MSAQERIAKTRKIISEKKIDAEVILHPEHTIVSAKSDFESFGVSPENVMKGLIFTSKQKFAAVIASSEVKIDMKKLSAVSGLKKPRFATAEELKQFDLEPGAVGPTTIPDNIPTFIDQRFMEKDEVIGSAGSPTAGLKIHPRDVPKIINAKIVDLSE